MLSVPELDDIEGVGTRLSIFREQPEESSLSSDLLGDRSEDRIVSRLFVSDLEDVLGEPVEAGEPLVVCFRCAGIFFSEYVGRRIEAQILNPGFAVVRVFENPESAALVAGVFKYEAQLAFANRDSVIVEKLVILGILDVPAVHPDRVFTSQVPQSYRLAIEVDLRVLAGYEGIVQDDTAF
jgi:hypothetical protein